MQSLEMATLGHQSEPQRIVEPATGEVQRSAHVAMLAANPMTCGTSAGTKFDADNYFTTNYATVQGEKLLMVSRTETSVANSFCNTFQRKVWTIRMF